MSEKKKVMVIAGEASGDLHGGNVISELLKIRKDVELFGTGGKLLKKCGVKLFYTAEELGIVGLWEVLKHYGFFRKVYYDLLEKLDQEKPDVVLLVDYPGFNLRFAEEVKKRGIKVIYYIAPQVWSWKKNRIHKIKAFVDKMIVLFPFEVRYFNREKMKTHCFGHPLLEIAKISTPKEDFFQKWGLDPNKKLVSLLPGSRSHEVSKHLPILLQMAEEISFDRKDIQFVYPLAPTVTLETVEPYLEHLKVKVHLVENDTYNCVGYSDFATVASGTATLETAVLQTPHIIFYKTSYITYLIGKYLLGIRVIGLPNIVAEKMVVPEMIQRDFSPLRMAAKVLEILDNKELYEQIKQNLKELKENLGSIGAYQKTAEFISHELDIS
ncbi:MAG: lipid-A-disaccharide synthase [bacterium]|jgi:lipid-A-disaccharide synthase